MKRPFQHLRLNNIWLAQLEKPALFYFCRRMPAWVTPDLLTALGFLAAIVIALSYWLSNLNPAFLWIASFGFVLNWFGDSLDGTLARHRKIERPRFGYFIDHTVDAFTQVIIGLGIGLSPYVDLKYALFLVIGYLLVSIHTYITIYVKGVFKISYGGVGPTEVRAFAILANTVFFFFGVPHYHIPLLGLTIYNFIVLLTGCFLIITYLVSGAKQALELAGKERAFSGTE